MNRRQRLLAAAAIAFLGLIAIVACQRRESRGSAMDRVGAYQLRLTNKPEPPNVGDNALTIMVRDDEGKPLRGAQLEVVVFMAAMGSMPYMESRAKIQERRAGEYQARYALSMGGEWDITLRIRSSQGPPAEAAYRLSTSTRGVAFMGGTPAAGADRDTSRAAVIDTSHEVPPGTVSIDAVRRQEIGIRVVRAEVRSVTATIRAAGSVVVDETREAEVTLKYLGFVREIRADFTGRAVRRGELLFTVYSPELWSAQVEYLEALRAARRDTSELRRGFAEEMVEAARRRLLLWDFTTNQIEAIARSGQPRQALPVVSPAAGVITEKMVVSGSAFQAGQVLYRIARLDPIWIVANVHQADLPLVRLGLPATVMVPSQTPVAVRGRVSFVYPELDSMTRTGRVRIMVGNPRHVLRPGTFVQVELQVPLGERLAIPESAIVPTGPRNLVFVDLGDGRLAPRQIQVGSRAQGYVQVVSGLQAGELVVASGNFLVAAESRLRSRSW